MSSSSLHVLPKTIHFLLSINFLIFSEAFLVNFKISASNLKSPQTIVFLFPIDSITFLDFSFIVYIVSNCLIPELIFKSSFKKFVLKFPPIE